MLINLHRNMCHVHGHGSSLLSCAVCCLHVHLHPYVCGGRDLFHLPAPGCSDEEMQDLHNWPPPVNHPYAYNRGPDVDRVPHP
jgi:hypothetical protein